MAGITFFILSRYSRWKIDSLYSLSFYSSLLRHPYNLIKRCLWNREDNIKCVSDFKNTPWWLQRQHKAHAVLKVLASKPFLFFLSRAVYNVVKDHSGNASSAVTKYPYSKHISRACNPPPHQILGWLSAIIWQLAGKTFFFFVVVVVRINFASSVTSLCQNQIILWLEVIEKANMQVCPLTEVWPSWGLVSLNF